MVELWKGRQSRENALWERLSVIQEMEVVFQILENRITKDGKACYQCKNIFPANHRVFFYIPSCRKSLLVHGRRPFYIRNAGKVLKSLE